MSVVEALARDLVAIREASAVLADSALAATAMALAEEMDSPSNSATSKSMCARVLTDVLDDLRGQMPAKEEGDELDDLAARRLARLAGRATA